MNLSVAKTTLDKFALILQKIPASLLKNEVARSFGKMLELICYNFLHKSLISAYNFKTITPLKTDYFSRESSFILSWILVIRLRVIGIDFYYCYSNELSYYLYLLKKFISTHFSLAVGLIENERNWVCKNGINLNQ